MLTSRHGKAFRITGPLWAGIHRPSVAYSKKRASNTERSYHFWCKHEENLNKQSICWWLRTPWRHLLDLLFSLGVLSIMSYQRFKRWQCHQSKCWLSLLTHTCISGLLMHIVINGHYNDVIMSTIASQITSLTIVYSTVYSGADQRKHQSSASLAFVRGIHRWPVNSPHKGPVTRKMFPFDDVIMAITSFPCWLVQMSNRVIYPGAHCADYQPLAVLPVTCDTREAFANIV